MNLWILKPVKNLPDDNNPWEPPYDCHHGMVVRAETENQARQLAHKNGAAENGSWRFSDVKTKTPWLDCQYSTCEILSQAGEAAVVLIERLNA